MLPGRPRRTLPQLRVDAGQGEALHNGVDHIGHLKESCA